MVWFTITSFKISKINITFEFLTNSNIEESDKLICLGLNIITYLKMHVRKSNQVSSYMLQSQTAIRVHTNIPLHLSISN